MKKCLCNLIIIPFLSQKVEYIDVGDFKINYELTFEIGGKHKTKEQIKELQNAYIATDDIEIGFQEKIPLWLFGFLY